MRGLPLRSVFSDLNTNINTHNNVPRNRWVFPQKILPSATDKTPIGATLLFTENTDGDSPRKFGLAQTVPTATPAIQVTAIHVFVSPWVFPTTEYYADPIPTFRFWSGRKNKYDYSCKIETAFLCGDGARVILFVARVIQQLGFWTRKIQANVDYCYVRRRAECTSLGRGLEHPSTLVWPRRDVPTRFTWCFFQQSIQAQHESCCSVCTLA